MMYHFNSIFLSTGIDQSQQIQVDDRPAPLALKGRTKDWSRPLEPLPARKRDIGTTADERRPYVRLIRAPVNRGGSPMPGMLMSMRTAMSVGWISPASRSNAPTPETAKCIT